MSMESPGRHAWTSWVSLGLLVVLCAAIAFLQYRWIGEISEAEQQRLRDALGERLNTLRRNFNDEISALCAALQPDASEVEALGRQAAYEARYERWRGSHEGVFQRIGMAVPEADSLVLYQLDLAGGRFSPADWPADWT